MYSRLEIRSSPVSLPVSFPGNIWNIALTDTLMPRKPAIGDIRKILSLAVKPANARKTLAARLARSEGQHLEIPLGNPFFFLAITVFRVDARLRADRSWD